MAREQLDDYQQGARLLTCERGNRPKGNKHILILIFTRGIRLEAFRRNEHVISGTWGCVSCLSEIAAFPLAGRA